MSAQIIYLSFMEQLPNRIREWRKSRGWKLEQLAEKVDTSIPHMSELERGLKGLTLEWMVKIAGALEVDVADLLLAEHNSSALSTEERDLVDRYRAGTQDQRDQLGKVADVIIPWGHRRSEEKRRA